MESIFASFLIPFQRCEGRVHGVKQLSLSSGKKEPILSARISRDLRSLWRLDDFIDLTKKQHRKMPENPTVSGEIYP